MKKSLSFLLEARPLIMLWGSVGDQLEGEMNQSTTYRRTKTSLDLLEDPSPPQEIRRLTTNVTFKQHTKCGKAPTGQSALKIKSIVVVYIVQTVM